MPKKIYLDSNVFITHIREEMGIGIRGLFVEAKNFFDEARKKGDTIVLSGLFFKEVEKKSFYTKEDTIEAFEGMGIKTRIVEGHKKVSSKEFQRMGLHKSDAIHAALAIEHGCDCIVTFNLKDFEKIKDKIIVLSPSD